MDVQGHMEALAAMQEFLVRIAKIKRDAKERVFIGPKAPQVVVSINLNDPPPKYDIEAMLERMNADLAPKGLAIRSDF